MKLRDLRKSFEITDAVMRLPAKKRLADYPEPVRTIVAAESTSLIQRDGIAFWLMQEYNDPKDLQTTADSLRKIGLSEAADAIQSVLSLCPSETLAVMNSKERETFYNSRGEQADQAIIEAERVFFSLTDDIRDALWRAVKRHRKQLQALVEKK